MSVQSGAIGAELPQASGGQEAFPERRAGSKAGHKQDLMASAAASPKL